jgi:hypothetical protein
MYRYKISVMLNDAESTEIFNTGIVSLSQPFYGTNTDGTPNLFSASLNLDEVDEYENRHMVDGVECGYKFSATQYWSAADNSKSVAMTSAAAFITRAVPTVSVTIPTGGVDAREYTFAGNYTQTDGDSLNWHQWEIADGNGEILKDTGKLYGSRPLTVHFDGFFNGEYQIRLTVQTENGVTATSGWQTFTVAYEENSAFRGELTARRATEKRTAVSVDWGVLRYIPAVSHTNADIEEGVLKLRTTGSQVLWNTVNGESMAFDDPWTMFFRTTWITQGDNDTTLLTITGRDGVIYRVKQYGTSHDVIAGYVYLQALNSDSTERGSVRLRCLYGGTHTVTAVITPDVLYLRLDGFRPGLYPGDVLYPDGDVYPLQDITERLRAKTFATVENGIVSVQLSGKQNVEYLHIVSGNASENASALYDRVEYTPVCTPDTLFFAADFSQEYGLNAGNVTTSEMPESVSVYRREPGSAVLTKAAKIPFGSTTGFLDYAVKSQQGPYSYRMVANSEEGGQLGVSDSNEVNPCFWNWAILKCDEIEPGVFRVKDEFLFGKNLASGNIANNNNPSVYATFTKYPMVMRSPANYRTGTLESMIGVIDAGTCRYSDTVEMMEKLYELNTTDDALFLKDRKGSMFPIRLMGETSQAMQDNTREQAVTARLQWVEIGGMDGISVYRELRGGDMA